MLTSARRRSFAMPPQPFRLLERIDLEPRPPILLVASIVQGAVMDVAQRHGPFVADLAARGAWLGMPDVVRLGGCSGANHARQAGDFGASEDIRPLNR